MPQALKTVSFDSYDSQKAGRVKWDSLTVWNVLRVDYIEEALCLTLADGRRDLFGWVRNLLISS